MNNKHFELTDDTLANSEHILRRIRATRDIPEHNIKKGDIGGFVESYNNLMDNAWVYDNAKVYGDAQVYGHACVGEDAQVFENAHVCGHACVCGDAQVCGHAIVFEHAHVCGYAHVFGDAQVYGHAIMFGHAKVLENAHIGGHAEVTAIKDYIVFKNYWSSGRYFTWTRSNNMWKVGCFYGTGEELIKKAYKDSEESGKQYKRVVDYVNEILKEEKCNTEKSRLSSMLCNL